MVNRRWYWYVFGGAGTVWGDTGWYLVVQYKLVLLGIRWNWVSTRFLCLCILKQVEIWSDVTIAGRTNEQGKIESLRANGPWTAGMSIKEATFCRKKRKILIPIANTFDD